MSDTDRDLLARYIRWAYFRVDKQDVDMHVDAILKLLRPTESTILTLDEIPVVLRWYDAAQNDVDLTEPGDDSIAARLRGSSDV